MLVTRELHKFYKDQELQGKTVDEKQRLSHQRLQERLSDRKSVKDAVKEHKAVVAALAAHANGSTTNMGDALAKDIDWRTKTTSTDADVDEFDLEELSVEQDLAIDEMRQKGTFNAAIDSRISIPMRRTSSLKIMTVLRGDSSGCLNIKPVAV